MTIAAFNWRTPPIDGSRAATSLGPLHGLPWAFKDLEDAVGFPATRGSIIFKDFRPDQDSVLVERLRHAGAIPIGKTNVPEFGMGSHTYNNVYGRTRNPFDVTKSAGGSSGGAGAALAAGLLPLADGSDLGGSLRNPGAFNNVVGLRPSVGLVPTAPVVDAISWLFREGSDGAHRGGRGIFAERDGWSRLARPGVLAAARHRLCRAARYRFIWRPNRLVPRSGWLAARPSCADDPRGQTPDVSRSQMRRGRGGP